MSSPTTQRRRRRGRRSRSVRRSGAAGRRSGQERRLPRAGRAHHERDSPASRCDSGRRRHGRSPGAPARRPSSGPLPRVEARSCPEHHRRVDPIDTADGHVRGGDDISTASAKTPSESRRVQTVTNSGTSRLDQIGSGSATRRSRASAQHADDRGSAARRSGRGSGGRADRLQHAEVPCLLDRRCVGGQCDHGAADDEADARRAPRRRRESRW